NAPLIKRLPGGCYRLPFGSAGGMAYRAGSYLEQSSIRPEKIPDPLPGLLRQEYLELPKIDLRIPRLAAQWTSGATDPETQANAIERHLRKDYKYSLALLKAEVPDPLAYFLFDRRTGHCEYFASAMAVMLRTLGIPSRVV